MAKVEVPKGILIALGSALAAALLALVFLLGRESGRRGAMGNLTPMAQPGSALPVSAGARLNPAPVAPSLSPAPAPLVAPGPAEPQDPQRPAVAAYFAALDRIAPGQLAGDPQTLAQEMVAGLAKGDTSGFDRLAGQAVEARRKVAALVPPASCAAFHQESLALLDENLGMLKSVQRALEGADAEGSLASMVAHAQALQARSDALQRADKALRQRYGLLP